MAQDIRELFKIARKMDIRQMPEGHEKKFKSLLDKEFPEKKKGNALLLVQVAASVVLLVTIGFLSYSYLNKPAEKVTVMDFPVNNSAVNTQLTLGDISPELKKIEEYYVTNINLELLDLEPGEENKKIIDKYLLRLSELYDEYKNLTHELNEIGPNEQTINALINNLQFRLQLLERLKEKLNELKNIEDDTYTNPQV